MNVEQSKVVRDELGRSAVWFLFSIFGWSVVLTQSPLPMSGLLWVGLILGSVSVMTGIMIGLRLTTGETFRSQGDMLFLTTVLIVGMYLVYRWGTETVTLTTYGLVAALVLGLGGRIVFSNRIQEHKHA